MTSPSTKSDKRLKCSGCSRWVPTLLTGLCPDCVIEASRCKADAGGRRCAVHDSLPIYPVSGLCEEGKRSAKQARDLKKKQFEELKRASRT